MKTPPLDIASTLRAAAANDGRSARELARACGTTHPTIRRFLAGSDALELATAAALARELALELVRRPARKTRRTQ